MLGLEDSGFDRPKTESLAGTVKMCSFILAATGTVVSHLMTSRASLSSIS